MMTPRQIVESIAETGAIYWPADCEENQMEEDIQRYHTELQHAESAHDRGEALSDDAAFLLRFAMRGPHQHRRGQP